MLCLSGFELYSRWVPLSKEGTHTRKKTASMGMKGRGARETVEGQIVLLWRTVALNESLLFLSAHLRHMKVSKKRPVVISFPQLFSLFCSKWRAVLECLRDE